MTSPTPQSTDFTRDVIGRYVCNGLDEALLSTDTSIYPDARAFDTIIIGGGTFGAVLAQQLFSADKERQHRILVLEAGPFVIPEHVQNLPMIGIEPAAATSIADQRAMSPQQRQQWSRELWGLPWHSNQPFPGLAYCIGGRSLFWGGWSPEFLPAEMHTQPHNGSKHIPLWPIEVADELRTQPSGNSYMHQAAEQIGSSESNDFIYGPLHEAMRKQLFDGMMAGEVSSAIPLDELPEPFGLPDRIPAQKRNVWKLEAPLAVQSRTRAGFFPFNKFSAVPVLIKASRAAQQESGGDDARKRLMMVPNCHVTRLVEEQGRINSIETSLGSIPVTGNVILAQGTIESTRLALVSLGDQPNSDLIGKNLMAHLHSSFNIRIPRTSVANLDATLRELQVSALFVKGQHRFSDGTDGYFHLQITASGLDTLGTNSEEEIFKKVPDIDGFDIFHEADDSSVVITIRGIGEMCAMNPESQVRLDPELDEYQVPRAFVEIADPLTQAQSNACSAKDLELWNVMDTASDDVARIFAAGKAYEILAYGGARSVSAGQPAREVQAFEERHDKPSTTHHETGTLWMGDDPTTSVTTANGRFHHVENAYALGPALYPTIGSPNPTLTGVALGRRMAQQLTTDAALYTPEAGWQALFNGRDADNWRMAGPGRFLVAEGIMETVPSEDIGMFWCTQPMPDDYLLRLDWMSTGEDDNSGVLLRFPDPFSKGYINPAYVATQFGFEVQIDELAEPDGAAIHRTGAIYGIAEQVLTQQPANPPGQWNAYEIQVKDQHYTVKLNGELVADFTNSDTARGQISVSHFVGLQCHAGRMLFRNIRIKPL
jgi:choline dehydrogenase-like flavoprotein